MSTHIGFTRRWARDRAKGLLAVVDLVSTVDIVRVERATSDKKLWRLVLSCGHEPYVRRTRKPSEKQAVCNSCCRTLLEKMRNAPGEGDD